MGKQRQEQKPTDQHASSVADLEWPPEEERLIITLNEQGWNLGSVQGYSQTTNEIQVQHLAKLKTGAKDHSWKTYGVYSDEDNNNYKETNVLDMQPSVSLAKNIKRKDPVFLLLNREIIQSVAAPLYRTPSALQQLWFIALLH